VRSELQTGNEISLIALSTQRQVEPLCRVCHVVYDRIMYVDAQTLFEKVYNLIEAAIQYPKLSS
jgi:hypothetical protein